MIPALVDGFYQQEENRQIRFHFTESASYDILNQIRSGALDLGFSLHQAEWAESVGVIRQPLYLAVPANHPLSGHSFVSFDDFAHSLPDYAGTQQQPAVQYGSGLFSAWDHS